MLEKLQALAGIVLSFSWARSSLQKKFGVVFLLLAIPFVLVVAYQIYAAHRTAKDSAGVNAQNLTKVIESRLATEFSAAVRSVIYVVEQVQLEAMQPKLAEQYRARSTQLLKSQVRSVGSASAMRIFAANGDRLYTTVDGERASNISDREFFRQLKDDPTTDLIFSTVVLGRSTQQASMYVVKPIRGEHARFLGVAVTAIDLTKLQEELQRLKLGPNGIVALRRLENGAIVVRYPGAVEMDNNQAVSFPTLQAIRITGNNGILEFQSPVDSIRRIYAYSTVGDAPLFVAVGLANMDYLAEWEQRSVITVVAVLLLLAALAATLARLARSEATRDAHEVDLRDSEARFRKLFSHNYAVIFQINPESGAIVDANTAATEFYGWSHQKLCSMNIADINLLDAEQLAIEREAAVNEQRNYFEFTHRLANGETRPVEVHSTPITFENKTILVSIIHDISERVQNANQVERLLLEQNAILNSGIVGIVKLEDRKFVWVNDAFAEMLGYTKEELIGLPTRTVYPNDEAYAAFAESAYPVMQRNEIFRTEIQFQKKNGTLRWYEISGGMLTPGSSESIWAFVDISKRKKAEAALSLYSAKLEDLVEDQIVNYRALNQAMTSR